MSAYSEVSTQFNDGELLISALKEMGFDPQNHIGKPQHLEGYRGDKRSQVADIIIPRKQVGNASNDIGFVKGADGKFAAIISQYDSSRYNAPWLNTLKATVADQGIQRQAKRAGLKVASRKVTNGQIAYEFIRV